MFSDEKRVKLAGGAAAVAVGIAVGLAAFDFLQAVVAGLVTPVIAIFVGDSHFELNSFTIEGSEFSYGAVIQDGLTLLLVSAVAYFLILRPYRRGREG
ncbi:MAG: MscL family protein [Solirubrobacterales bacterium]